MSKTPMEKLISVVSNYTEGVKCSIRGWEYAKKTTDPGYDSDKKSLEYLESVSYHAQKLAVEESRLIAEHKMMRQALQKIQSLTHKETERDDGSWSAADHYGKMQSIANETLKQLEDGK